MTYQPQPPGYMTGQTNGFMPTNPGGMQFGAQPNAPFVGRFVTQLADIRPNEVPTDGRPAIFPSNDLNEIYLKSWGADGLIRTFRYELDTSTDLNTPQPQQVGNAEYQQLASRLDQLEEMIRAKGKNNSTQSKGEAK